MSLLDKLGLVKVEILEDQKRISDLQYDRIVQLEQRVEHLLDEIASMSSI